MLISDIAIRRPVTTLLLTGGLLVFGYFAFQNMGVDLFPEVEFPTVTVTATLEGADPEIMDSDVTDILEEQINTIEGVKSLRSTSQEGLSQVVVEFVLSKDVDVAAQEVRDKINLAQRDLPRDLDPPITEKLDIASQPILWVAATTAGDYRRMALYADQLVKERIQSIPGVGSVRMGGFRDREIRVWLDTYALEARGLTPRDVATAIQNKHIELPGGRIEQPDKEFVVKVKGEYASAEAFKELVVLGENGALVRLKDVAKVVDGTEDLRAIARYNGLPSVGLGVRKQSGTNTVAVARAVKRVVAELAKEAPEGINLQIAFDSSRFIEISMRDVLFDLFLGAILTSGVMLVFLRNFRMTFISVLSIPVSIIACFIAMYALGFTVNNMTTLAMSLAIGIVIDDAIVVMENIFRHVEDLGENAMEAAYRGTSEVGLAVLAASSAIIAVFVPVAFMKGIIGRFFFQFGLSVAMAVFISLVVSFTLTAMLCSRLLRHSRDHGIVFGAFESMFRALESLYSRILDLSLRHRWVTLGAALLFFVGGISLLPVVKKEFVVQPDESRFLIRAEFPTGTSIYKTDSGLREIERVAFSQPEIRGAFAAVGFGGGVNNAILFVNMYRPYEREASQSELMTRLRKLIHEAVPDARVAIEAISPLGGGQRNADVQFVIQGPEVDELQKVATSVIRDLNQVPGFVDVDDDLRLNKPEVRVDIDRDLADDLRVDVRNIADNFNILFGGQDVAKFKEGGNQYDIRLRSSPEARRRAEDLYQISLRSAAGEMIRLPNLVEVREGVGPNSVNRYQRRRSATIFANLEGLPMGEAMNVIKETAARHIPKTPDWSTALSGRSEMFAESFQYLVYALVVSLLVIYIILGSQFESFIHPFTIMMSVPLAIIGGFGLLVVTGKTLDIFSFIGFIMLIGIVTKNAILLVDFTNQERAQGMNRDDALRRAGPLRLRPILMTALTTMASVVPVALAISEGGEQRAPMGVAVFGGMFTSTFLTLLVIPCFYTVMDDLSRVFRKMFGFRESGGRDVETDPAIELPSADN